MLHRARKVAIVGTRSPTPYGLTQATRFARALACHGVCVVSGMARGIDETVHGAALDAGGSTIAILGCGVDRPWPAGPLAERIGVEGLLLSEYAPGTRPRRHHFPLRNRLISGLCDAVLVLEAARASGSLITARWASDQGRTVFVVPGRVDHPMSAGVLRLLREGASPVGGPEELLSDLYGTERRGEEDRLDRAGLPGGLGGRVLGALVGESPTTDELALRLGEPVSEVLAAVATLELEGRLARCPGGVLCLLE